MLNGKVMITHLIVELIKNESIKLLSTVKGRMLKYRKFERSTLWAIKTSGSNFALVQMNKSFVENPVFTF